MCVKRCLDRNSNNSKYTKTSTFLSLTTLEVLDTQEKKWTTTCFALIVSTLVTVTFKILELVDFILSAGFHGEIGRGK